MKEICAELLIKSLIKNANGQVQVQASNWGTFFMFPGALKCS